MRCRCYLHAQLLAEREMPVRLVESARVEHELPPLFRERFRRGYDSAAVTWIDPTVWELQYVKDGIRGAFRLRKQEASRVKVRADIAERRLGYGPRRARRIARLCAALRFIDLAGAIWALWFGPSRRLAG